MSLLAQAALDARMILEDPAGFSRSIKLMDPEGVESTLRGFSIDIGEKLDPETGQLIAGTHAKVHVHIAAVLASHSQLPGGATSPSEKPWLVTVSDVTGTERVFMVTQAMPDRTLGVVRCELETYRKR